MADKPKIIGQTKLRQLVTADANERDVALSRAMRWVSAAAFFEVLNRARGRKALQHASEEQGHADRIAARITQLGGAPDLNPKGLASRSHSEYVEGNSLVDMIRKTPRDLLEQVK